MPPSLTYLPSTDSTNNRLKQRLADGEPLPDGYCLYTFYQTAGRGQQGNSWESERGCNLLFSYLFRPEALPASHQFRLSMLVSVAVADILAELTGDKGISIKWPNDIYYHDRKICGILIENQLAGSLVSTAVAGVGINVNQTAFVSDAPNPVSLRQITGRCFDLDSLMTSLHDRFRRLTPMLSYTPDAGNDDTLRQLYMSRLYRSEGWHLYKERTVSLEPVTIIQGDTEGAFEARIVDVDADGCLCLMRRDGSIKRYHFKQLRFVI